MKNEKVHCLTKPPELQYNVIGDNLAEVWIRKNITQQAVPHFDLIPHFDFGDTDDENTDDGNIDNGDMGNEESGTLEYLRSEETLEYVYDEVYFLTSSKRKEIEADLDTFWQIGMEWKPEVPESEPQKIARLEKELKTQKDIVAQNRNDSDMAIAELTMVMAAMMGGA